MGPLRKRHRPKRTIHTAQLIRRCSSQRPVSDLIFSPGRAPQVEVSGELVEMKFKGWSR